MNSAQGMRDGLRVMLVKWKSTVVGTFDADGLHPITPEESEKVNPGAGKEKSGLVPHAAVSRLESGSQPLETPAEA